jgi:hypothetical protein
LQEFCVTKTLKDLTIVIAIMDSDLTDSECQQLYDSTIWKDLDLFLLSAFTLQHVVIHFHPLNAIPARVWVGLRESMPFLEERGILIFQSDLDIFPEQDRCQMFD